MTDEQEFRLLELLKAICLKISMCCEHPEDAVILEDDLKRFEQSLETDDAKPASRRG